VECEGELLEAAVLRAGLHPTSPVMRVGHDDPLLRCFLNIADTIREDAPGFEAIVAMRSLEIVARIRSLMKISCTRGVTSPQKLVKHAQVKMREALDGSIDFHQLAQHLGISYTTFRRVFKQETGRPPGEYFIEMKINRAKELLLTDRSIQEVADLLGFESVYYFSRLFKARTGSSPSALRPDPSPHRRH
jgi:AraC-like DNA-binding protein